MGKPAPSLNYTAVGSDANWTLWTGALVGSFLGRSVNLGYSGALSGFPPGTITWTTTGTFGGGGVAGSGTATISYPTLSTFDLTFSDTLAYGGNSITANVGIPGTFLSDGSFMDGSLGHDEAGVASFILNGVAADIPPGDWSYHSEPGSLFATDDIVYFGHRFDTVGAINSTDNTFTSAFFAAPEPITLSIFGAGLAGAVALRRRKKIKQA